ncbi:MAG: PP2C family protein-serine/threonine phosphatase, partial [Opitutales bacterium]
MNAYTRNLGVCVGIFLLKISAPLVASEEIIVETLAQAPFDECVFYEPNVGSDDRVVTPQEAAAGLNPNDYFKSGLTEQQVADCYAGQGEFSKDGLIGLAKRNQAYVWGLKKKGSKLWFGTGPNVDKLVGGSYFGSNNGRISDSADNIGEFASSKFAAFGVIDEENDIDYGFKVDASFGDYRPPSMYCYDLETETLTRLDLDLDPEDAELNWKTLGLRSVGYTAPILGYPEGIVFIAGPSVTYNAAATTETLPEVLGVNMFALNAATGECIGSKSFPAYSNIRKWLENDGQLYTTVANQDGTGAVLKHNNNPFRPGFPFNFDVVGNLDSGGAEIEAFEGRLFVNTWPGVEGEWDLGGDGLDAEGIQQILTIINGPASLYRSPVVPPGGLRPSQANRWTRVWSSVDYDPDFAMSLHYGGGAMEVFDGYLHWGTMHVNNTAQLAHSIVYGNTPQPNPEDYELGAQDPAYLADLQAFGAAQFQEFVYPQRWISIWRGKNFNRSGGEIDLLYGASTLPTRMKSDVFRRGGDPRGDFALIKWALFLINNLGTLREIEDGDVYLLCSDGLSGMIPDEHLLEILVENEDLEAAVAEMVDQANRNGGTDNITTLVLRCSMDDDGTDIPTAPP